MLAVAEAEEGMENAPEVDNMLVAEGLEPVPETERLAFQLPPRACQQAWSAPAPQRQDLRQEAVL